MTDHENLIGSSATLKQKLLQALQTSMVESEEDATVRVSKTDAVQHTEVHVSLPPVTPFSSPATSAMPQGSPLRAENSSAFRVFSQSTVDQSAWWAAEVNVETPKLAEPSGDMAQKKVFDDKLSMRGVVPDAKTETHHPAGAPSSSINGSNVKSESVISGGSMADLSGYKDLSKAPISFGDDELSMPTLSPETGFERAHTFSAPQHFVQDVSAQEVDTEFSGNVKTLIRLVNELPEGVTKQTGAQIIRLTMEAMGISMEDVLSEAQSAQSEMLDAVRANIKKIEEYKTVIRKLETDIKYYQGRANELSEIIDLFILSNTTGNKMSMPDDMGH